MAKKINGAVVELEEVRWGFEFEADEGGITIIELDDEAQARFYGTFVVGKVVVQEVYRTDWAEVAEPAK